jgi:uncharacterized protein YhbP (UPF0306 family)
MRGSIKAVESKVEWQTAWQFYQEKFPFVIDLKGVIATSQMYAFTPDWIRLVDNRKDFGYKQEWVVNTTEMVKDNPPSWRVSRDTNG